MAVTNEFENNSDMNEHTIRKINGINQSFQADYNQVKRQVKAKEDLTNVPRASVFEAAVVEEDDEIET